MTINNKHAIWIEKYRPQKIDDLILPQTYLDKFKNYLKSPSNILLCSINPGTGKTSTVNAIINEGEFEGLFINASLENGIDVLRGKIVQFASTESFDGKPKIVVLDECDNLTEAAQKSIRGIIEETAVNCRFILTCNYINNIIPAVQNRFEIYNFDDIHTKNRKELITKAFNLLIEILHNEKVTFKQEDLIEVIKNYYPSIRGMIACLQKSNFNNELELDIQNDDNFLELIDYIKKKDFQNVMKIIYGLTNADKFYEYAFKKLEVPNQNKPQLIIALAKYQYQSAFARDKNLNLAACIMEIAGLI